MNAPTSHTARTGTAAAATGTARTGTTGTGAARTAATGTGAGSHAATATGAARAAAAGTGAVSRAARTSTARTGTARTAATATGAARAAAAGTGTVSRAARTGTARTVTAAAATGTGSATGRDVRQVRRSRAGQRSRARRLGFSAPVYLAQAHRVLAEAVTPEAGTSAGLRYASAHLAALRCAAAVLAVRGRPSRRRAGSAWVEVAEVAPELEEWAGLFTESADLRATAEAGLPFPLDHADVDAFCRVVAEFLDDVERLLDLGHQAVLPTAS